ncbi:MAG TPA: VWA domain-containing protein [Vicinamibacterales bacterium]|nr:VWA domain-containing protein [Vicinamibacterales bacterium]
MMRTARFVLCGVVAVVLLGPARALPLHGQSQQTGPVQPASTPQTTFRSTTSLVEVDAVILDSNGKFVPGLTAEDLALYEDGKPQSIQQFYMVSHDASAISPTANLSMNGSQGPEERAHRVFVLVFDEGSLATDSLMRVKAGAEKFILEQLGPGDVGGVFVNGSMYHGRLTTDKNELLMGVRSSRRAFDTRQSLLAQLREFPKIPSEVEALQVEQGALEVAQRLADDDCRDDPGACQEFASSRDAGTGAVVNAIQQKARLYVRQSRTLTAQTVQNLQYVAGGLAHIPGRKTLVLLSEGFFVEESRPILQNVAAQAARGGTTIYSIDGRGNSNTLSANPDVVRASMSRSQAFDTGDDGPLILTSGTGGFTVHGIDDFSRALNLVARDTSTYYVIGYRPDNSVMDGKYRKIDLKPTVPGLNVRARKGYLAVTLPPLEVMQSAKNGGGR